MSFHDAFEAELQLNLLVRRGRIDQMLSVLDDWLAKEPWRTELLLRKMQLLRATKRFEEALHILHAYRALKPDAADIAFWEIECQLDMGHVTEAMWQLDSLPASQRHSANATYYHGRILLARHEIERGLPLLWHAYQREPGFNRALLEWATIAVRHHGKRWVRHQLESLIARQRNNPTVAVSVALALNLIDSRRGRHFLRRAVEKYAEYDPAMAHQSTQPTNLLAPTSAGETREADAYHVVSEHLLVGHFAPALDAYYQAVNADPSWMTVLAPLVAELLVNNLQRPEEARVVLEDAMRRDPTDYRLHQAYARVFQQLGFGEEALSAANCALELTPETEKGVAFMQRAEAFLLLRRRDQALLDLRTAVALMPEIREILPHAPGLKPLARDTAFRALHETITQGAAPWWAAIHLWFRRLLEGTSLLS